MTGSPSLLLPAAAVIAVLLSTAFALFFGGLPGRRRAAVLGVAVPGAVVLAFGVWLLLGAHPAVGVFQGSVAAAAVCVVLAVGLGDGRLRGYLVFSGVWIAVVLVPLGYALFDVDNGVLVARLGIIDFATASVIGIATGTAALALAVITRQREGVSRLEPRRPLPALLLSGVLGAAGWVALAAGAELIVDPTTPTIIANLVWAMAGGVVGWVVAQLLGGQHPGIAGAVAGLHAGAVVALSGAPWLEGTSSALLGLGAGILGHVTTFAARRAGAGPWSAAIGIGLAPAMLGLLGTGIVARGVGLVFSGQAGLLSSQATGLAIAFGYSLAMSLLIAFAVQRTLGLRAATVVGDTGLEPMTSSV